MKSEFIGIAIGTTQMVAIRMEKTEAGVIINDSIVADRQGSLLEDCKRLIQTYSLEGQAMGMVALVERQEKTMILPRLPRIEVAEMLRWTVPEFVTWPEDSYYYDFMLADMPSESVNAPEQELLYVVALQRQHITDLATGALKGGGNLKIIDSAPAPLARRFVEKSGAVIGIVHDNEVEFTSWYNGICMSRHSVSNEMQAIMDVLAETELDLFSYGVSGIAGVQIYEGTRWQCENLQWQTVYEKYGRLTPIPFEERTTLNTVVSEQTKEASSPMLWDMALGLAYRGVMRAK
ncbi:hypothetical protein [Veillonella sp.]|uniref:hypothetical protein n=1 Tax=Veillonella sp. TaxID=1926307 RepID=UPI0025ED6DB4|nr:hypothetical protein [Veillonella sp.]